MQCLAFLCAALMLVCCGDSGGSKGGGTADQGTTDQGTADQGTTDQGTADQGTTDQGTTDEGTTDEGTADQGTADQGTTDGEPFCEPLEKFCQGQDLFICQPDGHNIEFMKTCGAGELCEQGACACKPQCDDKSCGDDGCGGSCGACESNEACTEGQCKCVPSCEDKESDDDGCGGQCECAYDVENKGKVKGKHIKNFDVLQFHGEGVTDEPVGYSLHSNCGTKTAIWIILATGW
jgi:hypothetical protein